MLGDYVVVAYAAARLGTIVCWWVWSRQCRAWKWDMMDEWRNKCNTWTPKVENPLERNGGLNALARVWRRNFMWHVNVPNKLVVMRCVRGATISHDGHLGTEREHEDTVVQSRHQSPFEQCWCKKIHNWNKEITCAVLGAWFMTVTRLLREKGLLT